MLYSSKKNELLGEHVISTVINLQNNRKKRTNSATLVRNDKIVSKLLNMSLLASELGGSQLATSERKDHERINRSNKNLK
jgi:hypothetical protein